MWLWACVVPHPPIIVPEVGQGREKEAAATLGGFGSLLRELEGLEPDVLLVLSPHAPRGKGLTLFSASSYSGDLGDFGASRVRVDLPAAPEWSRLHELLSGRFPLSLVKGKTLSLDHGALVPLAMLKGSLGKPALILANPTGLTPNEAFEVGKRLREAPLSRRWALLASGDLSHRLAVDGPYGLHPDGAVFDRAVNEALRESSTGPLEALEDGIVANAGQCGLQSVMFFLGLAGGDPVELHSYEAPFGVGYATASWKPLPAPVSLARMNLRTLLETGRGLTPSAARRRFPVSSLWDQARGCFVSLKTQGGRLRGCIGTLFPVTASLGEEILRNSISAARSDPRFPPVRMEEWKSLTVSVDVLGPLEPVASEDELDPRRWGVVVASGERRGVLLPDLPGVDSVDRQLAIAREKAGILPGEECKVFRFAVTRYQEGAGKA